MMEFSQLFSIAGKRALVTGGSAGIGAMIAEGLVRAGAEVTIVSRKKEAVEAEVARLAPFGTISGMAADLATEEGVNAVAEAVNARGALHILVNNAGATWGAPIDNFPRKGFAKVVMLNLLTPFDLTRALLPALRQAATAEDPARVINISSIDGIKLPIWESYPYSASKAGLNHMTRHMGKFLAGDNISVNAIAPGFFPSRMTASVVDLESEEELESIRSPLGRRVGGMEDIAGAVIYLSSRAGAWLSGVVIPVSGGTATIT